MIVTTPLRHAIGFWKPMFTDSELEGLATYRDPGSPPMRGINVWRSDAEPRLHHIVSDGAQVPLFASVHPIGAVPPGAEVVADIVGPVGEHLSYVLSFPAEQAVVVPFDPDAAVEAFWYEDWVPKSHRTALPKPLLALYYTVGKRLLPRGVKHALRRALARRALASPDSLQWPIDDSLDRLQRFLLRLVMLATGRTELQFAWFWPDAHTWAVALTHDVETAEGLARVTHVSGLESQRGFRSSFNMVPRDYEVPDSLLRSLNEGGFEVGVHGYTHDGLLFSNEATFRDRAPVIDDYAHAWGASGFRSPATYRNRDWLPTMDFEYDSSYSNTAPCEPQPGGCGSFFPYPLGKLVELPITLPQDHTLYELFGETDASTWLTCLERIRNAHGMACVLGHPDPADGYIGMPANEAHYLQVLDTVSGSGAWTPLPRELARWWRARFDAAPAAACVMERASLGTARLDAAGGVEIAPPR